MDVPNALIRSVCFPTSYRLPKLERLVYPPPKPVVALPSETGVTRRRYRKGSYIVRDNKLVPVIMKGNLPNGDYRLFYGSRNEQSKLANCRWCELTFPTLESRREHEGPCKRHLLELYSYLRRDQVCICCETPTIRRTWGVPLCCSECDEDWKFENPHAFVWERNEMKRRLGL